MDAAAYLADPDDLPPPPSSVANELPKLFKPDNIKSRFWVHFMKYDAEYHPDKKTSARCTLCGKDISVKQGTGGLKNHMKFKHPVENSLLISEDVDPSGGEVCSPAEIKTIIPTRNKKPRLESAYADINGRRDIDKRIVEKHLMEMWSLTRREIRQLRVELKDEEDEDIIRELESDLRVLQKRKTDYAESLGFPKDDEDTNMYRE